MKVLPNVVQYILLTTLAGGHPIVIRRASVEQVQEMECAGLLVATYYTKSHTRETVAQVRHLTDKGQRYAEAAKAAGDDPVAWSKVVDELQQL